MIVLDTNIIVALLDKGDTHHRNAIRVLEDFGDERVYILNVNLSAGFPYNPVCMLTFCIRDLNVYVTTF